VTRAAAAAAEMCATTAAARTAAATVAATATATAAFIGSIGRGRQRSGKNKDDNPELEIRHEIPLSVSTF